jgi:hypothetical protein
MFVVDLVIIPPRRRPSPLRRLLSRIRQFLRERHL